MAVKLIIGNQLIDPAEYKEKKQLGDVFKFEAALGTAQPDGTALNFKSGEVKTADFLSNLTAVNASLGNAPVNPFTPIGIGKPLSVEILTVYKGDYPSGFFGGKKDILLTSAVKNSITYDAAARAINAIEKNAQENEYLEFAAPSPGTKVVYYSKAEVNTETTITFEMIADGFEQELFDQISKLLGSAGGLPVFLPASTILLAGSYIVKAAGDLGNTLFASKAYLNDTFNIQFGIAGLFDSVARQFLICNDRDSNAFDGFTPQLTPNNRYVLINTQTQEEYKGNAPYIIINIDGKQRDELNDFSPKLASTSILQKFYGADDMGGQISNTIDEAMQLYNDLSFKRKAESLKKLLDQIADKDSVEYKAQEALLNAYKNNIKNDEFKVN